MKFPQSIRFQLQLWYGVLLVALLGGLGLTAYRLERSRLIRVCDEELQRRLPVLVDSQRPVEDEPELREFELSHRDAPLFRHEENGGYYYVVWLRHGVRAISRSATAPSAVPEPKPGDPPNRSRGDLRESFLFPGPGDCILVGRSIHGDLAGLRQFGWWLGGVGGGVLVVALTGGSWLITRALRPIQAISSAAAKIATGDLSERIQTGEAASELGQLAQVLNGTFARLEAAFTRQARFTADAAHELRTPLTVMLTHTQNSLASDDLTPEHREAFEANQRAAQRMRRLTESLLTLARLDSGGSPPDRRPCDLAPSVHDAIELLRPFADRQSVRLISEIAPCHWAVDAEQFSQIVTNLVSNAIFYNRPGGEVRVTLAIIAGSLTLIVADTGQGISAADLPHIFERFYRADRARSGMAGNVGLGLSISMAIVQAHGGTLTATSELGHGSCFTARFPNVDRPI